MMSIFSRLAACLICLLLPMACSPVAVQTPIGNPLDEKDSSRYLGEWTTPDGEGLLIARKPESIWLSVSSVSPEDSEKATEAMITKVLEEGVIAWAKLEDHDLYTPVKLVENDDVLIFFVPDGKEVKRLVKEGKLSSGKPKSEDFLLLDTEGLEEHLANKSFWDLENVQALFRKKE